MLIWYFSNNLDIYDYVGKLPKQHFSVRLFSNPGDNILFLLKFSEARISEWNVSFWNMNQSYKMSLVFTSACLSSSINISVSWRMERCRHVPWLLADLREGTQGSHGRPQLLGRDVSIPVLKKEVREARPQIKHPLPASPSFQNIIEVTSGPFYMSDERVC